MSSQGLWRQYIAASVSLKNFVVQWLVCLASYESACLALNLGPAISVQLTQLFIYSLLGWLMNRKPGECKLWYPKCHAGSVSQDNGFLTQTQVPLQWRLAENSCCLCLQLYLNVFCFSMPFHHVTLSEYLIHCASAFHESKLISHYQHNLSSVCSSFS